MFHTTKANYLILISGSFLVFSLPIVVNGEKKAEEQEAKSKTEKSIDSQTEDAKLSQKVRDKRDLDKMIQFGLAIHSFHDVQSRLPFAKELLGGIHKDMSWRVRLIQYMGKEKEFGRIDFTRSWQDKNNKLALDRCNDMFFLSDGSLICGWYQ